MYRMPALLHAACKWLDCACNRHGNVSTQIARAEKINSKLLVINYLRIALGASPNASWKLREK